MKKRLIIGLLCAICLSMVSCNKSQEAVEQSNQTEVQDNVDSEPSAESETIESYSVNKDINKDDYDVSYKEISEYFESNKIQYNTGSISSYNGLSQYNCIGYEKKEDNLGSTSYEVTFNADTKEPTKVALSSFMYLDTDKLRTEGITNELDFLKGLSTILNKGDSSKFDELVTGISEQFNTEGPEHVFYIDRDDVRESLSFSMGKVYYSYYLGYNLN